MIDKWPKSCGPKSDWSVDVLVRVAGPEGRPDGKGDVVRIGRYHFLLCEWYVTGHNHPVVVEWWPMPEFGTGTEVL